MTVSAPIQDEAALQEIESLAQWLDARFRLPGTNFRFGLDGLVGLIPGVGDAFGAASAIYLIMRAERLGVPRSLLLRMGGNVAIDTIVGTIPLLGDLFDFGFKANRRNAALVRRHFEERTKTRAKTV